MMSVPAALLPDLPALLVIADELHFGRAAARLNISQPRVSQIVRRIEDVVGYAVFVRRPQVRLTPAGELLTKAARHAFHDLGVHFSRAAELAAGAGPAVRMGYSPVAMFTRLPQLLRSVRLKNPAIKLDLHEVDTAELWNGLETGKFDIIISREARARTGIASHLFARDDMVAAVPEGGCASSRVEERIADLRDRDFIMIDEELSPQWHHAMTQSCRSAGFDPRIALRVNDWPATLALVANGVGVSMVSSTLAQVPFPGVAFRSFSEGVGQGGFWVGYREEPADPAVELVRTALTEHLSA